MSRRLLKNFFSLLHVNQVKLDRNWNFNNVISPYYRLYFIDEGKGYISSSHGNVTLESGFMYIIPSFTICNLHCPNYLSQYFIHFFEESPDGISLFYNKRVPEKIRANEIDIALFKRILEINPGRGISRSQNPKDYEKNVFYHEYEELNNKQNLSAYLETQGILLQLLSRFLETAGPLDESEHAIPIKVLDAIGYIQVNLHQDLTVAQLAKRANQHQDYFSRVFYQYTGIRPLAYIHEKRIERAQYLLTTTNMSYEEVATAVGFDNLPHFSKVFKKVTSLTPGQYRQQRIS
ncbi:MULTISPECIES: helix-turn-helix domain-containing protein [Niastella]|uniref:Helix-turn-helix transcriptional regulator n=1 Tax=Niastella soli TaxID=2821487 RepID=A0ABS3YXA7_9BACT|nr:AraC family transcriptional regulator [Niastella soli]MBO9202566.1 helix-turn-helix transcriptional regulator [Niastella soli]